MEVVDVDPARIAFKISPDEDLRGYVDGDWDLERRLSLETAAKHVSIRQRFVDGLRWEDTEIFRSIYPARFEAGEPVIRGRKNIEELLDAYYTRVDGLFESLKRRGFVTRLDGNVVTIPRVLFGRDGEPMLGNQGNHRVAMSKILGIKTIPCEVQCRHASTR